jgi:hemerythrin-like metal-binding protein
MAFFEWKDSMSVGHPMIDRDHKMLIQYLSEMHLAMMDGKGKDVVGAILNKLVAYTRDHFGREEIVWKSGRYADLEKHKKEHADLLTTVGEFKAKYDKETVALSVDVMNFLRDWLKNHILKSDKGAADAIAAASAHAPKASVAAALH